MIAIGFITPYTFVEVEFYFFVNMGTLNRFLLLHIFPTYLYIHPKDHVEVKYLPSDLYCKEQNIKFESWLMLGFY